MNRDGSKQPGEPPLDGWEYEVWDESGFRVGSCTTDTAGVCDVMECPGRYLVTEREQDCWDSVMPAERWIDLPAGETKNVRFGNYELELLAEPLKVLVDPVDSNPIISDVMTGR